MSHEAGFVIVGLCVLLLIAVIFVTAILFCCSVNKTMSHVPVEKRLFPNWFIWMTLIPMVNFIFAWMIFPFGIPSGLKNTVGDNATASRDVNTLRNLGWALQILATINFILSIAFRWMNIQTFNAENIVAISLALFFVIIASVLWTMYWVKIVSFRKKHFGHA